ncbi:unnamed protein product [Diamesa tonsa]
MINQPLLLELQIFIAGKNNFHRNEAPEITQTLVRRSLKLLDELPVYRDAIFEFFSMVVDVSIGNYIKREKNPQSYPIDDNAVLIIKEGLEKLLHQQSIWASFISQWSLTRLIKPSIEYSKVLNFDFNSSCKFWLECKAINCLLSLSGFCITKFSDIEAKRYVFDLENIFVDNRPNFDWAVAHLSSLFPLKFISNILRTPSMLSQAFIPSTVTVLEYHSLTHDQDLKVLLKEIIDEALEGDQPNLKTKDYIPNLIQLASKSDIYSQSILNVFLDLFSDDFISKLKKQFLLWPLDYNPVNLQLLLPELILKTKENGTKLLLILANTFENYDWCRELLEVILTELEALIFQDKTCPLFTDIRKYESWQMLWDGCVSNIKLVQQTSVRLIMYVSSDKTPLLYYKTIDELITMNSISNSNVLSSLARILGEPYGIPDVPDTKVAISHVIQKLLIDIGTRTHQNQCYYTLKNLVDLVMIERGNMSPFMKRGLVTHALQGNLKMLIIIWENLLQKIVGDVENIAISKFGTTKDECILKRMKIENEEDDPMEIAELDVEQVFLVKDQIHMLAKLMDLLDISDNISISDGLKLEKFTVKYLFWCLIETDSLTRCEAIDRCYTMLSKQCLGRKVIRSAALRDLLEGALFVHGNLFGTPGTEDSSKSQIYHQKDELLLKLNQKQGIAVSRSSVLHSGVIGSGVPKMSQQWTSDGLNDDIRNIYLKALVACCHDEKDHKITTEGFSQISLLLVELVSSDVMYNGLPWPTEEFSKVTMERDLHIRRTFRNSPILWSILGLLATYPPSLCYCSVFLRAICASVLHHWRAKSTETISGNNIELMFFTTKLLELLALGQLLPPPLSYLYIVVEHLEPNEIAYVLKECVWNYMVANVPAPALFATDSSNRLFIAETNKVPDEFQDPLRNTMQKRLASMGNLYYQMFVLPKQLTNGH